MVGHSLENDLKALRVVHAKVLDTAVLFPHPKVSHMEDEGSISPLVIKN